MIDNLIGLNINSSNRKGGNPGNFIYDIQIEKNLLGKITHVGITNVNIPKGFYNIQTGYNEFHLGENNIIIDLILPFGNYNRKQFFFQLGTIMTNSGLNSIIYTVSDLYGTYGTGQILITATNNINNYDLGLIFIDKNDINEAMGFEKIGTNNFVNNVLIGPNIINLNYANNLILHGNCVGSNYNDMGNNGNDILCNIYCASFMDFGQIALYFDIIGNMKKFIWPGRIKFFFTNEDGDEIDFNNVELSFTINFFSYTGIDKLYKLMLDYSQLKIIEKL